MAGLPAVSLEAKFAVSIDEVISHKTAAETSAEKYVVTKSTADRLWVCTFVDSFVGGRDSLSLDCCLENLRATFMTELQLQQSLTDELLCQVSMLCDICVSML